MNIQEQLSLMADKSYKSFHQKLIPTVPPDRIIGVRTPRLRKFAKELSKNGGYDGFITALPHFYYEENNLHAFLIEEIADFDLCIAELDRFLPYVDNWATCDSLSPRVFFKNKDKLILKIPEWLASRHTYLVRFGICMLMKHFLDRDFDPSHLKWVADIKSREYYVEMAVAWYFSVALVKKYDHAISFFQNYSLSEFAHNMAISKAIDSRRIPPERKALLRTYKIPRQ